MESAWVIASSSGDSALVSKDGNSFGKDRKLCSAVRGTCVSSESLLLQS